MLPDVFKDRWEGPAWRWWALAVGLALALGTALLGSLVALVIDGDVRSLILLGLLVALLVAGVVGSGMLEGLSGRAIAGGMARQPLPERRPTGRKLSDADQLRRDRTTLRAGLVALPLFVAFLGLLIG